ncbi:hypothetical protein D3C72_2569880 [compost metagenome]
MQYDALPAPGAINCLDGASARQSRCLLQVIERLDSKSNGSKAAVLGFLGNVHIRQ